MKSLYLTALIASLAMLTACDNNEYSAPASPTSMAAAEPVDYAAEARAEITEDNYDEALAALAAEINMDDASIE
jgi:hypothetical protein